jgi:FdhD protein
MDDGGNLTSEREVCWFDGAGLSKRSVSVIRESSLRVFLNGRAVVEIACLGTHGEELAVGFLRSEGLLVRREDLRSVAAAGGEVRIEAAVAPGRAEGGPALLLSSGSRETACRTWEPVPFSPLPFTARDISTLMEEHLRATELHARTRGTHASSLAGETGILMTREDIGRHNTIDMIGGHLFLQNGRGAGKLLLTTGRLSSEMVRKVWNLGIPSLASHAAATSEGIETAKRGGLTLIGCVRDGTMKIYTHHERIRF